MANNAAAPARDLTSLKDVKEWMDIQGTGDDRLLQRLITASSSFLMQVLNRDTLFLDSYSETYPGNGTDCLVVRNYPITSIQSLTVSGVVVALSPDKLQPGYWFDANIGTIYLSKTAMPFGAYKFLKGSIVVVNYKAGYLEIPFDVAQVCIEMCASRYWARKRQGRRSETLAGQVVTYETTSLSETQRAILQQYRRIIPN